MMLWGTVRDGCWAGSGVIPQTCVPSGQPSGALRSRFPEFRWFNVMFCLSRMTIHQNLPYRSRKSFANWARNYLFRLGWEIVSFIY